MKKVVKIVIDPSIETALADVSDTKYYGSVSPSYSGRNAKGFITRTRYEKGYIRNLACDAITQGNGFGVGKFFSLRKYMEKNTALSFYEFDREEDLFDWLTR